MRYRCIKCDTHYDEEDLDKDHICINCNANDYKEEFLFYACEGLLKFGGSFANALGNLLLRADLNNQTKITRNWTDELHEHAALFIKWAEKNRPDLLRKYCAEILREASINKDNE